MKAIQDSFDERLNARDAQRQAEMVQTQVFNTVTTDPKYSEAFITDNRGMKTFNPNSQLAVQINNYLQDPRVKSQPDALLLAAKLARADLLDSQVGKKDAALTSLKRQTAQLKQKTLTEGGGTNNVMPVKDGFQEAQERLSKTGSRKDAETAIAEYFKKTRG
jgi:hypothetical protein